MDASFIIPIKKKIYLNLIGLLLVLFYWGESAYAEVSKSEAYEIASNVIVKEKMLNQVSKRRPLIYDSDKIKRSDKNVNSFLHVAGVYELDGKSRFSNAWIIMFKSKMFSLSSGYLVVVNKLDGEVLYKYSGDVINNFTGTEFGNNLEEHKKCIQAIVKYHQANKMWPKTIENINEYLEKGVFLKEGELTFKNKNVKELIVIFSDFPWKYHLYYTEKDYRVNLISNDKATPQSLQNMVDSIFETSEATRRDPN